MSVLEGPREEWRRILHQGTPVWVRPEEGGKLRLGDGRTVEEANATYLPPCDLTKIICIHLNYDSRRVEFKAPPLVTPTYFQKPLTTLNSHRGFLNRPADCQYLNYEGEIAAIVGKPMRNVAPEDVWDHKKMAKVVSHTQIEIDHLNAVKRAGDWVDVTRKDLPNQKLYSWWSYRAKDWDMADRGRRLDHIWASADIIEYVNGSRILREVRGWDRPSDHVPVFATIDL
mgnify:CR=1 FL=1